MSKSISTLVFCLSFIIGTFLSPNFFPIPQSIFYLFSILALLSWISKNKLFYFFLALTSLQLAIFNFNFFLQPIITNNVQILAKTNKTITGTISDPPIQKNNQQKIILANISTNSTEYSGRAQIVTNTFPQYHYGQTIMIKGLITTPKSLAQSSFSYSGYLAKNNIYIEINQPQITIVDDQPNSLVKHIYNLKDRINSNLKKNFTPLNSSLLSGILLGEKNALPQESYDKFRQLGLTHIIVVSGFNLAIFANLFIKNLRGIINRHLALFVTILCLILFTILTGAESSIIRALIMSITVIISPYLSRHPYPIIAIFLTATIMIFQNPLILWYDLGFHLSFLATIGIFFISNPITTFMENINFKHPLINNILECIGAQITTTPYLIYLFHKYSLLSLPANFIIVPLIPFIMIYGLINIFTSILLPEPTQTVIALPLNIILNLCHQIIELLSQQKIFNFSFFPDKKIIIIYYFLLSIYVYHQAFHPKSLDTKKTQ